MKIFCAIAVYPFALLSTLAAAQTKPMIATTPAQNGAVVVALHDANTTAIIHYTEDGSTPTAQSPQYFAPFLVTSSLTVKAVAIDAKQTSEVASQALDVNVAAGALVWSDEFANTTGANAAADPKVWIYEAGGPGAFGNHELEVYCAAESKTGPCDAQKPNGYVGTDGYLHIVAQKTGSTYTSARLATDGRFSVRYGRVEARIRMPEAQGMWPAFWLLGNDIKTVQWPACGEQDVMEHVNKPSPDWVEGSVHGIGFIGDVGLGKKTFFPAGVTLTGWHTYGMTWGPDSVAYYVDDPAHPYVTYTSADLKTMKDAVWPFDRGQSNFILLNLAVGGDWPKSPDATTLFPAEMLVDYVRVFKN